MDYKVFAVVGESTQSIDFTENAQPLDGMIEMQSERPLEGDWIAAPDGTWIQKTTDDALIKENSIARRKRENIKLYSDNPNAAYSQLVNMTMLDSEKL